MTATTKHKYSPAEETLLKLLPRSANENSKRITINELAKRYYDSMGRDMPFHARIFINSSMRTLIKKTKVNRDHRIMRSNIRPYQYWIKI